MAIEASLIIRCDICRQPLLRAPGYPATFPTYPAAEAAAVADRWEYMTERDEQRVVRQVICHTCTNRRRAMHAWIQANRADR